jgi:hypothetical protein
MSYSCMSKYPFQTGFLFLVVFKFLPPSFRSLLAHLFLGLSIPFSRCSQFIHSSTKKYTDCFQVWGIMNKLLRTYMCRFSCGHKFSAPLGKYQRAQLTDYMVRIYLVLWETTNLPKWLYHFEFLPAMNEELILAAFGSISVLDFGHSKESVMVAHHFSVCFSDGTWCGASFHVPIHLLPAYLSSLC